MSIGPVLLRDLFFVVGSSTAFPGEEGGGRGLSDVPLGHCCPRLLQMHCFYTSSVNQVDNLGLSSLHQIYKGTVRNISLKWVHEVLTYCLKF